MANPISFLKQFLNILQSVSVEPAIFLVNTGLQILLITADLGLYRLMCDKFFNSNGGTALNNYSAFDCWDTGRNLGAGMGHNGTEWWPQAEAILQSETASFGIFTAMAAMLPSVVMNIALGAYGDRRGRKGVILLGYAGTALSLIPYPFLFAAPKHFPLYVVYIVNGIGSLSGAAGGAIVASAAYLSDTAANKEALAVKMTILQLCITMGIIIGPLISNSMTNAFGYVWTFTAAIAMCVGAFISALALVSWVKPAVNEPDKNGDKGDQRYQTDSIAIEGGAKNGHTDKVNQKHQPECFAKEGRPNGTRSTWIKEILETIKSMPVMVYETWRAISKPRTGRKRAYVLTAICINFIFYIVDVSLLGMVFTLYVQKEPIRWAQREVSFYRSITNAIRLLGTTAGVFLLKKYFKIANTLIIIIALVSTAAQTCLIASASASWMLHAAAAVGAFSALQTPCTQAFLREIVESDEVGKVYSALGLGISIAMLISFTAIGAIYKATVTVLPNLVFVICAALICSGLLASLWLHFDSTKARVAAKVPELNKCERGA